MSYSGMTGMYMQPNQQGAGILDAVALAPLVASTAEPLRPLGRGLRGASDLASAPGSSWEWRNVFWHSAVTVASGLALLLAFLVFQCIRDWGTRRGASSSDADCTGDSKASGGRRGSSAADRWPQEWKSGPGSGPEGAAARPKEGERSSAAQSGTTPGGLGSLPCSLKDLELLTTIGKGSFSCVHLARPKRSTDTTRFALKVMKKRDLMRPKLNGRAKNEAHILKQIDSPFCVDLITDFQDEHHFCLLLEFVSGGTLRGRLQRAGGSMSVSDARFYISEAILGLRYLHSNKIVHRDVKPENLLIDRVGHLKITDFGFAKRVASLTWTVCGTIEYLAPELVQWRGHGAAVDAWALGVISFELLAGKPPFRGENSQDTCEQVLRSSPSFPPRRCFDESSKDLIMKLLNKKQEVRLGFLPSDAGDIQEHKWFEAVDWDALFHKGAEPPRGSPGATARQLQ